jgi:DNA primase
LQACRILLEYLRNGHGTTAIGTYSPRARKVFPIAAPVSWPRVEAGIKPDAFTIMSQATPSNYDGKQPSGQNYL